MSGSTPGPWRVGQEGNFRIYGPDAAGDISGLVAEAMHRRDPMTRRANAHLIAAAPAMYEALKAALPFIDDAMDAHGVMSESAVTDECRAVVEQVRAALAAAEHQETET